MHVAVLFPGNDSGFMIHLLRLWENFLLCFMLEVACYFAQTEYTDKKMGMKNVCTCT